MRTVVAIVALALQVDTTAAPRRMPRSTPPCVPTEHMPVAGLGARPHDRMPIHRADSSFHSLMPVLRLQACYLVDSLTRRR